MKKFNLLLFTILLSFNVFSQIKTYTYEKYGIINEHTNNTVLTVPEKLVLRKTGESKFFIQCFDPNLKGKPVFTFSVEYKGYDELNEKYIYIGDAVQEMIAGGKCLINSSHKLDIYLENKGKEDNKNWGWDGDFSFKVYLKNMKIPNAYYNEYIDDTSIKIFPIKNKTAAMIQKENEEISKEQEEEKVEIEKIEKILSEVNIEEKVSQIKTEIENHYKSILKDKMTNVRSVRDIIGLNNLTKTLSLKGEFMLHINKRNQEIEIIQSNVTCTADDCSFSITDGKSNIYNKSFLFIKEKCKYEYEIEDHTYYKLNDFEIFTDNYKIDKKLSLKVGVLGIKFKNEKVKYYIHKDIESLNVHIIPEVVNDWCTKNIKTNGFYIIHYIIINDELACRILNLDMQTKVYLKQYLNYKY